jgi:hypothetical protein
MFATGFKGYQYGYATNGIFTTRASFPHHHPPKNYLYVIDLEDCFFYHSIT